MLEWSLMVSQVSLTSPSNDSDSAFNSSINVTAIGCLDSFIVIGTHQGHLIQYQKQPESEAVWLRRRGLSFTQQPVISLTALSTIGSLMAVYVDRVFLLYSVTESDLKPVGGNTALKSVDCFAITPENGLILIAKKNKITAYSLDGARLQWEWECLVEHSSIRAVQLLDQTLCYATETSYFLMFQNQIISEIPHSISPGTFRQPTILSWNSLFFIVLETEANGAMGLFLTSTGEPTKSTCHYPLFPMKWAIQMPCILALTMKQVLSYHGDKEKMIEMDLPMPQAFAMTCQEPVLVACQATLFQLNFIPDYQRLLGQLAQGHVESVLQELDTGTCQSQPSQQADLYERVALALFQKTCFDEAAELWRQLKMVPEKILLLYGFENNKQNEKYLLKDILKNLNPNEMEMYHKNAKEALLSYLEYWKSNENNENTVVDIALICLWAEQGNESKILSLIESSKELNELVLQVLENEKLFYAKSMVYLKQAQHENVLEIWFELLKTKDENENLTWQKFLHVLSQCESDILLKYLPLLDPRNLIQLMQQPLVQSRLSLEQMIQFIQPLGNDIFIPFLENMTSPTKDILSHLMKAYSDQLMSIGDEFEREYSQKSDVTFPDFIEQSVHPMAVIRLKLIRIIESHLDLISHIRLHDGWLYEQSWRSFHLQQFDRGLNQLLALNDFLSAERYLLNVSQLSFVECKQFTRLTLCLLEFYLERNGLKTRERALQLLEENRFQDMDLIAILRAIPETWSLRVLIRFLSDALSRQGVVANLDNALRQFFELERKRHYRQMATLKQGDLCCLCEKQINEWKGVQFISGKGFIHGSCQL